MTYRYTWRMHVIACHRTVGLRTFTPRIGVSLRLKKRKDSFRIEPQDLRADESATQKKKNMFVIQPILDDFGGMK